MAIGMALLLGFHFPHNFRRPYLAFSITDFWHRWHMSLSRWLRDYLYIPLGGNRHGTLKTYRNLMLTMLLGGLWHGASWNFVIWGGYHGALLAHRAHGGPQNVRDAPAAVAVSVSRRADRSDWFVGWVFFRAATFADSRYVIGQMFSFAHSPNPIVIPQWLIWLVFGSLIVAIAKEKWNLAGRAPAWAYVPALGWSSAGHRTFWRYR